MFRFTSFPYTQQLQYSIRQVAGQGRFDPVLWF